MSDFLLTTRPRPAGELASELERYLAPVTAAVLERHGAWGSLAVASAAHDGEVLREEAGFLSVLVGEPIVRAPGTPAGRARVGERREAVHQLLRAGAPTAWDDALDGPYAALGLDTGRGDGIVVSDLAGFIVLYAARDAASDALVIGTHPDAVARAAGRGRDLDPVSAVDLIVNLTCTYPYTLYRGVEQLPPASSRRFGAAGWTGEAASYWRPEERRAFDSPAAAAAALRERFAEDVRLACDGAAEVGILLSGGEDARAVLGAVPDGVRVRAFTFADWENREVRVARRLAKAYGADFRFGARAPTHYLDGFPAVAALVGAGNMFIDVHGWGFHERLGIRQLPVVLGGLSSDSFLKAYHAPGNGGAELPFEPPRVPLLRPALVREMVERRNAFRRQVGEIRPESVREWERIWPFSMRKHGANLHGNRRLFATHEPYHSNGVVKLAASVPLAWKYHRALFLGAMRPFLRRSWHVPHADYRYPFFGRFANLPLGAALGVARGARAVLTGEIRARQRPWPKWRVVVGSDEMRRRKAEHPALETPLRDIFTSGSPGEVDRVIRAEWHPHREMMLLQLSYLSELAEG